MINIARYPRIFNDWLSMLPTTLTIECGLVGYSFDSVTQAIRIFCEIKVFISVKLHASSSVV